MIDSISTNDFMPELITLRYLKRGKPDVLTSKQNNLQENLKKVIQRMKPSESGHGVAKVMKGHCLILVYNVIILIYIYVYIIEIVNKLHIKSTPQQSLISFLPFI